MRTKKILYKNVGKVRVYSPQRRVVKVSDRYYNLPFPYTCFYFSKFTLAMGFTTRYCKTIIPAFLPHIEDGVVCLDSDYDSMEQSIRDFWQSSFFRSDFQDVWSEKLFDTYIKSFTKWEKMSLEEIQSIVSSIIKKKKFKEYDNLYDDYDDDYDQDVTKTFDEFVKNYR